ncbi:MAG: histidine kinase [Bacteroidota bacterium]|nr:histidine kinase [Bacteroidota bacterium]
MHPILSDKKRTFIYLLVWLIVGVMFAASMTYVLHGEIFISFVITIPVMMIYSQINLASWYIAKAFPLGKTNIGKIIGIVFGSSAMVSVLFVGMCVGWIYVVSRFHPLPEPSADKWLLYLLLYGLGEELYLVSLAVSYLFTAVEHSREVERNAYEMQFLAQSAELKVLRMQVNPHFLFNSLNSINALVSQNHEQAREMTTLLAEFFRKSLQYGSKETITLSEELSLLTNYLTIEKIRFGSRLVVEQNIDESVLSCQVPPLLLQPLLENAIKYGISSTLYGGTIRIRVEKKQDRVFLILENPIDEEAPMRRGTGLGLQIVKKRLNTIFGSNGDLQTFREGTTFRTILFFPVRQ